MTSDTIETTDNLPKHIAIIMDGNGRWATKRGRPRAFGHKAGVDALKSTIEACIAKNVEVLTVFAFSSENWLRPEKEVSVLMNLFFITLKSQAKALSKNNIRLKIIGYREAFSKKLQAKINDIEQLTASNTGLTLVIAANYGGQWDMLQATKKIVEKCLSNEISSNDITTELLAESLSTNALPDPDLFIRTGGDYRVSNFLLWQLAYCEMYFTDVLWPDFGENELFKAVEDFSSRQRRFGRTGEQVQQQEGNV